KPAVKAPPPIPRTLILANVFKSGLTRAIIFRQRRIQLIKEGQENSYLKITYFYIYGKPF
ncbi:MAG: hypothetical protein U0946_02525, partial [Patescibacteria group bacterium]|nr:hypothetical protein [Patescibacteria group bacterium]